MDKYLEIFTPIADTFGVNIVDIDKVGNDILELGIARKDFVPVDLDLCAQVAEAFGEAINYEIGLDVGSAGAERIIEPENYIDLENQYVFIQFMNPFQGADYVEGTVKTVDEENVTVTYRQKTALKEVAIERKNIKMLRLAVKV